MRAPVRSSLRSRFLAAIAAGSALATVGAGCGGSIESVPGTTTSSSGSTASTSGGSSSGGSTSSGGQTTTPAAPDASPPPEPATCEWGKAEQACYTHDELQAQYDQPSRGGDTTADAGPPPWDPNGCLPKENVQDGCCNPAITGPTRSGDKCCYVHCTGACCGRPFVVEGEARVAPIVQREDWMITQGGPAHRLAVERLDGDTRSRLARAWSHDAAMEHASVAAFARFVLDLLSVGAPPEVLLDAQQAMRDEIEHARACFTMASRYAGRAIGPDALEIGGAGAARSLAEIAAATVKEGAIGETLSAELAEERARGAAHPYTRSVLEKIADDEARHAELAWRFVGWAVAVGGAPVRAAVARAIDEAFAAPPDAFDRALATVEPETARAHGLLDAQAAHETVARALREVVAPCAAATVSIARAA